MVRLDEPLCEDVVDSAWLDRLDIGPMIGVLGVDGGFIGRPPQRLQMDDPF